MARALTRPDARALSWVTVPPGSVTRAMLGAFALAGCALGPLTLAGCTLDPVVLEGKGCPCSGGYVCDPTRGVCTRSALPATDAGAGDAGGADAAPDGGDDRRTRCDDVLAGALFCDGFEDTDLAGGVLGPWSDTLLRRGGNLETIEDPIREGTRALQAFSRMGGGRAAVTATFDPPVFDGALWVREWLYLPASAVIDTVSLLYVGNADGSEGTALQTYDGGLVSGWIGPSAQWQGTMAPLPRDRWTCLQYRIDVADAGGALELYVDGVSVGRQEGFDTLASGGYTSLEAGIEYTGDAQEPLTLYIDEVAVGRERMPCE